MPPSGIEFFVWRANPAAKALDEVIAQIWKDIASGKPYEDKDVIYRD
jgi:hypothetical protein